MKELILLKVIEVKNAWFGTIRYLIMNSNFKILYADVLSVLIIVDYCCIIHNINKPEAINLLDNPVLEDCVYIQKFCLIFQSTQGSFFSFLFFFSFCYIYKIVHSECSTDIYKSVKISIETVMRNSEMLKFVPYHLKTKKMCKNAVTKLPSVTRYVSDRYMTQQMCDKGILENSGTLESVPDCCKN